MSIEKKNKIKKMKKRKRKTFKQIKRRKDFISNLILFIVLSITVITSVMFAFAIFISKVAIDGNTLSYFHGYSAATVISGSMEPTLHVGDIVIIKKVDNFNNDDIITFFSPDGELYTHRIVSVGNAKYKTKGDANNTIDDFLAYEENIIGVVEYRIPYLGKYLNIISNEISNYYIIVLVVITISLIISIIYDIVKLIRTDLTDEELKILESQELNKRVFRIKLKLLILRLKSKREPVDI